MNAKPHRRVADAIARTPQAPQLPPTERPPYVADPGRYDVIGYRHTGQQRPAAAGDHAGPVAQLRRRRALRQPARPRAARLRPGRHAVRPGQQLRAALRLGRGELRRASSPRTCALPRRAGHHHQGRLGHVVRPLRLPGLAQVPAGLPRPVAWRAWASTTSTSSTPTASTRTRPSRRRWAPSTARSSRARPATWASAPTRPDRTREAIRILAELGTPLLIHQPNYSMFNRWIEERPAGRAGRGRGVGCIAFSPLAQGLLTDRYLKGIPAGSRASQDKSMSTAHVQQGEPGPRQGLEPHRPAARPVAGPDGHPLGAARPAGHLGPHRRQLASPSWRTAWVPWTAHPSATRSWPRSTATPGPATAVDLWAGSSRL